MRITIELHRPARRSLALLLGLVLLAAPTVVLASHQFNDVPDGHSFHNDIDWLSDYGITLGFGDGTFRPSDPVTRGQIAAFMRRLSSEFETVMTSSDPGSSSIFSLQVDCPDDKRAISGGGLTSNNHLFVTDSHPASGAWRVRWESDNGVLQDPSYLQVWALCAPRL